MWRGNAFGRVRLSTNTELAPFLSNFFGRSYADGAVPSAYKAAYVTSISKKPNLDPTDARSYRPISNLSFVFNAAGAFCRHSFGVFRDDRWFDAVTTVSLPSQPIDRNRCAWGAS